MFGSIRSYLGFNTASQSPRGVRADEGSRNYPCPLKPSYIVGDVHGRADLLELVLGLIDAHVGGTGANDPQLVFVGDYIDRGPDSADVIARLMELQTSYPDNVTCLLGNHERMLLDFLDDPQARGPRWFRAGASATLKSYGLQAIEPGQVIDGTAALAIAQELGARIGADTRNWLETRPLSWSSGNLWAVHAGADPAHAMTEQNPRVLLWGHPEFEDLPRADGAWIAHGHVEHDEPFVLEGRIALDTGAWRSGRLTCFAVKPDGSFNFLQS